MNTAEKENTLEQAVRDVVLGESGEPEDMLNNVLEHGCQSGIVPGLIYYDDTTAFYQEHKEEINALLSEILSDTGLSAKELFGDRWNSEDPLALDRFNQNLLAWFGFEETARKLEDEITGYLNS